jgi:hypothetical protein
VSTPASVSSSGLWRSIWPAEDGGPARRQVPHAGRGLDLASDDHLEVAFRSEMACTMTVWRDLDELFLLTHTLSFDDATARVERIDPISLEPIATSPELPAGPMWPGGLAAHADGGLHVVFGRWAHRLDAGSLEPTAATELPVDRPWNSFVVMPEGALVTKDFGKDTDEPATLVALDPGDLRELDRLALPERSIARLSADGDVVLVVGDEHLWSVRWDDSTFTLGEGARYGGGVGQGYAWDVVVADGAGWMLDDGEGTERYGGCFRGKGVATAPLHLVRTDLATGAVTMREVCGQPGGIVANPPIVDEHRRVAVAFDSGNGAMVAFGLDDDPSVGPIWRREQDHAAHMVLFGDTGELVTHDFDVDAGVDHLVVLDVATGQERGRVATGSPLQSVLFPAPGLRRDVYSCSFAGISRVAVADP